MTLRYESPGAKPSVLSGLAAGVNDIHFHPALPRTARLTLRVGF
jgi:hypothetical protein